MTKRFIKVNSGAGPIQFPGGYPANDGQVAILDDEDPRLQEYFDYGATKKSFYEALAKLVQTSKVKDYGSLVETAVGAAIHTVAVPLPSIANGEVFRFKPGFAGYVVGYSALSVADATTASKAATITYTIDKPSPASDVTVGASGNPATLDLTSAAVTDGGTITGEAIVAADRALNTFGKDDWIVATASSVTAFVEGAVVITTTLGIGSPS